MAETFTDPAAIKAEYKKRRLRVWLIMASWALLLIAFGSADENSHTLFGVNFLWIVAVGSLLLILGGIFLFLNWRCPACNKFFRGEIGFKQCPGCGAEFQ